MDAVIDFIVAKYNYWVFICLMMVGLYAMIAKKNLIKKIIGMNIFQTAIILFYISIGAKRGATLPIYLHGHGPAGGHEIIDYINPVPHVLMLTAIVVSVATFGVALALAMKIYRQYGTLEEDEISLKLISIDASRE
ncbi:MAG: cation:proton antiporter subunit C [Desulfobacterales bacterium]|jgi:multicomponent Na+:H+ antiporter subunit C|nr:cation:proton antiporter subunit C [Desulfobacterales bacterium]